MHFNYKKFRTSVRLVMLGTLLVCGAQLSSAQNRTAQVQLAFQRAQHLRHGVNLSLWFAQHPSDYSARHTSTWMHDSDLTLIAKMGFDNVRLSIDPVGLEQRPVGPDGLNADFVSRLDHVVDTSIADGLAVQVDVHPEDDYKQKLRTDNEAVDRFVTLWSHLAAHYANRDPKMVFFEILNEPEVQDPYRWAGIQARVAAAIRQAAPQQTIIATGPNYSDIVDLLTQHPLEDGNVIYNFHFYDPHTFTHQGAGWAVPWWADEHGIPYPPDDTTPAGLAQMHQLLQEIPAPSDRFELEQYWLDHWDAHRMQLTIDAAAAWGKENNVPVICNEFGVYRRFAPPDSRDRWLHDVRTALENDGIGWDMWDYHGGFGVVNGPMGGDVTPDAGTVEALGLKSK